MPKRKPSAHFAKQAQEAYELSIAGYSYRQIAEKMGVSLATVQRRLELYIKDRAMPKADEYRTRQISRLEVYIRSLWTQINNGDPKAIAAAVRTEERIAKLMGTDSATLFKVEATAVSRESDANEAQQLLDAYFGRPTASEPKVIPHIDLSQRKRRPTVQRPSVAATNVGKAEPAPDEFPDAIPAGQVQEFEPEPVEFPEFGEAQEARARAEGFTEPVSAKEWDKKRRRPHNNPAHRFLRDTDD